MNKRIGIILGGAALVVMALAGCTAGTGAAAGGAASSPGAAASGSASSSGVALSTASTSLGTVVVDAHGKTVYTFDQDKANSGKSACTGACIANWPAVDASSSMPTVKGVTGTIGTIAGADGTRQITLDGKPLYTFVGDTSAGDATGQGVEGFTVASPAGTTGAGSAGTTSSAPGGYSN